MVQQKDTIQNKKMQARNEDRSYPITIKARTKYTYVQKPKTSRGKRVGIGGSKNNMHVAETRTMKCTASNISCG